MLTHSVITDHVWRTLYQCNWTYNITEPLSDTKTARTTYNELLAHSRRYRAAFWLWTVGIDRRRCIVHTMQSIVRCYQTNNVFNLQLPNFSENFTHSPYPLLSLKIWQLWDFRITCDTCDQECSSRTNRINWVEHRVTCVRMKVVMWWYFWMLLRYTPQSISDSISCLNRQ